jgi:hypothetical protein
MNLNVEKRDTTPASNGSWKKAETKHGKSKRKKKETGTSDSDFHHLHS